MAQEFTKGRHLDLEGIKIPEILILKGISQSQPCICKTRKLNLTFACHQSQAVGELELEPRLDSFHSTMNQS